MSDPGPPAYTVDDLDRLTDEMQVPARLELDVWGSLIVSPVDVQHELAREALLRQARAQLPERCQVLTRFPWTAPGGSGYVCVPDLAILHAGWRRVGALHVDPPPFLVVEVASQSTWRADHDRKPADYRVGRAGVYLLVELPSTFVLHDLGVGTVTTAVGSIDLVVDGHPVRFTLA